MAGSLRFDRGARYGAALVGVLFAAYLNIATDFSTFILASNYAGSIGTDVPLVNFVQFFLIMGLYLAAFVLMPVDSWRRVLAVTITCVTLFLWATLGIERGVGNIKQPVDFWEFILNQGFVTLLVSLGGWLVVRGRHPVSYLVLVLLAVPPLVAQALDHAEVTSGAYTLVTESVVVLCGVVGAWLAAVIDRRVRAWLLTRSSAAGVVGSPTESTAAPTP